MKQLVFLGSLLVALSASAAQQPLFAKYEAARQAMLKASLPRVQSSAKELADAAIAAKQTAIASGADGLSRAANINQARAAFAVVSDEIIKFRNSQSGVRPAVAYCSMEKKSWLQPKGAISNPYLDESMRSCGEFKE